MTSLFATCGTPYLRRVFRTKALASAAFGVQRTVYPTFRCSRRHDSNLLLQGPPTVKHRSASSPHAAAANDDDVDGDGNPIPPEERDLYADDDQPKPPRQREFSDEEAMQIIGMGSWRLQGTVASEIELLVAQIEGATRNKLRDTDFMITQPKIKYQIMDSIDPEQEDDGTSYKGRQDPEKGSPGYPRMLIENRCYANRVFRKIHFEVVWRQDGLQVLHIVMYPRPEFDLPIFGLDLVGNGSGKWSLAVVDLCPVSPDMSLPPHYITAMSKLQEQYGLTNNRLPPDWGSKVFSPMCVLLRPDSEALMGQFIKYSIALTHTHYELSRLVQAVPADSTRRLQQIDDGHRRFCEGQMENKKTTRALEAAFGKEIAEKYLTEMVFDYEHAKKHPVDDLDQFEWGWDDQIQGWMNDEDDENLFVDGKFRKLGVDDLRRATAAAAADEAR